MTTQVTDKTTVRREYIAGLRQLAELEEQPDIPTPYEGNHHPINIFGRAPLETAELLRTHVGRPAAVMLRDDKTWTTRRLDGVAVQVSVPVEQVSKRTVTGTYRIGSETREQVELLLDERWQPAPAEGGAR